MKEKLIRFMQGRYGTDTLSKFLLICGLVVVLFSSFSSSDTVRMIWYVVGWALIIYCYYRMFSRNVTKRYAENQAFLARTYKIRSFFKQQMLSLIHISVEDRYKKKQVKLPKPEFYTFYNGEEVWAKEEVLKLSTSVLIVESSQNIYGKKEARR